jgi:sirohydrochlorin cobaltochelatase
MHGSRDPRPQRAIDQLATSVAQCLQRQLLLVEAGHESEPRSRRSGAWLPHERAALVGTAALELAPVPLHQQIQQFALWALGQGVQHLQIVPLFLLPGVHVMEDIPAEVAIARQLLAPNVTIDVRSYLGSHPQLTQLLLTRTVSPAVGKILLAHGSRRAQGNRPVEAVAAHLEAVPAYWSVAPRLEEQVRELIQQGYRQVAILPYFLFAGGITDAIEQEIDRLAQLFPAIELQMGQVLGPTPQLAELIVQLLHLPQPEPLRSE